MLTLKTLQWGERHDYGVARFLNITSNLSLFFISTVSIVAQQNIKTLPSSPNVTPAIRVSSQFVVLDALVENRKTGNLVDNLEAKDFQVAEDKTHKIFPTSATINYRCPSFFSSTSPTPCNQL